MNHFLQAISDLGRTKGRMKRDAFSRFMLFFIVFWFVALMVDQMTSEFFSFRVVLTVYNILMIPTILSAIVRRLHDTGNSGKWVLLLVIVSVLGVFINYQPLSYIKLKYSMNTYMVLLFLAILLALTTLGVLVYKLSVAGDVGTNKYGPDPKEVKGL